MGHCLLTLNQVAEMQKETGLVNQMKGVASGGCVADDEPPAGPWGSAENNNGVVSGGQTQKKKKKNQLLDPVAAPFRPFEGDG